MNPVPPSYSPAQRRIEFFDLLTASHDWFQLIIVDWPYRNIRYGYLWWYAEVDGHEVRFAWGHGGQFITFVPSLDLVVVTTPDNFLGDFSNTSWYTESSIFRLIARDVLPAAYRGC